MTIPCIFCSHAAADLASLREHSATCAEHPAVKRCKVAEDWITVLEHSLVDYRDETDQLKEGLRELQFYRETASEPIAAWEKLRGQEIKIMSLEASLAALRAELAETHDAMHGLMPGLDECWVISQEGIIAFQRAHGLICQREKTTRAAVLAAVAKQETGQ